MEIAAIMADDGACGHYRIGWPSEANGIKPLRGENVKVGRDARGNVVAVDGIGQPDVLVMQRVGNPAQLSFMKYMQDHGTKVVVDFDDNMGKIHKDNYAHAAWERREQHWRICDEAALIADRVTVTTERLADRYGKHGRVRVVPNRVPENVLDLEPQPLGETPTFGWPGFTSTHPHDCKMSAPAAHVALEGGARLLGIGDARGLSRDWGMERVDGMPSQKLGRDYYIALGHLDVGLVGLQDNLFNNCKSYLKVLELAAMGVPSIASPTRPHKQLASSGFPVWVAHNEREWRDHAKKFLDRQFLAEASLAVREAVRVDHTIEGTKEEWMEAWTRWT